MAVTVLTALDLTTNQLLNIKLQNLSADPAANESGLYYNTTAKEVRYHNGTSWIALGPAGAGGPPTGAASGDLSGSYPSPQIAAGVIVDADVATANKDGTAGTPSLRTLGTGAAQACAGNDSRLTDSRNPTGTASGHLTGTYPGPSIANGVVTDTHVAAANKDGVAGTASMRTLGTGSTQALAGNTRLDQITAPTASVALNNQKITGLATPSAATDAATMGYVDITAQGLTFKNAVRVVATTNRALTALTSTDGVSLAANDRVLLAGQTTPSENGIWLAQSGAWTRATDADASGEIRDGTVVPVAEGTAGADSLYICTATGASPWVPGTSSSTWTRFTSVTDLVAGNGLTKTGATLDFVGDVTLTVTADQVSVASAPKWTTGRTISLTGDVTGTSSAFDGTGNLSFATVVATDSRSYAADVGAGTSVTITHNLNTRDVVVEVFRNTTPWDTVTCDIERTTVNTVTLRFATAVSAAAYRCLVRKVG